MLKTKRLKTNGYLLLAWVLLLKRGDLPGTDWYFLGVRPSGSAEQKRPLGACY
jgi:hypothetical protein